MLRYQYGRQYRDVGAFVAGALCATCGHGMLCHTDPAVEYDRVVGYPCEDETCDCTDYVPEGD